MAQVAQSIPSETPFGRVGRGFPCTFAGCQKEFKQSTDLHNHIRTHTGEKPYECGVEDCGKAFATNSQLRRHERTHTKEKPCLCSHSLCGKRFRTSSHLKRHMKVHVHVSAAKCGGGPAPQPQPVSFRSVSPPVVRPRTAFDSIFGSTMFHRVPSPGAEASAPREAMSLRNLATFSTPARVGAPPITAAATCEMELSSPRHAAQPAPAVALSPRVAPMALSPRGGPAPSEVSDRTTHTVCSSAGGHVPPPPSLLVLPPLAHVASPPTSFRYLPVRSPR